MILPSILSRFCANLVANLVCMSSILLMKYLIPLFIITLFSASAFAQNTRYVPDDFPSIQDGIDGSVNGDTLIVRDGTYFENLHLSGKSITLTSENGPTTTIIDGSNQWNDIVTFSIGSDSTFKGFTVTNGGDYIAGARIEYCSPTIEDCVFSYSGGVVCKSFLGSTPAAPTFNSCTFSGNVNREGAGIYFQESNPTLNDCTFYNNQAPSGSYHDGHGGAIYLLWCTSSTINRCTFINNRAKRGGAISSISSNSVLKDCVFTENSVNSNGRGGGIYFQGGIGEIEGCTFAENERSHSSAIAGGIYTIYADLSLKNSILWDNAGGDFVDGGQGSVTVTYTNVGRSGTGNINTDPLFVDAPNNDFRLQSGSPCIDAGDPNSSPDPDGTVADMGALYFEQSTPVLRVTNLIAGQTALIEVVNATPNNFSHFVWSIRGGGPTWTPWGDAMVTAPYHRRLLQTDATGYAFDSSTIPASAAGLAVWCHGTDIGTQSMLNPLMFVIQ